MEFEKLFTPFGCNLEFLYLKSFSRVRVTFNTMEEVAAAKVELHHCNFRGTELGVFFVEVLYSVRSEGKCVFVSTQNYTFRSIVLWILHVGTLRKGRDANVRISRMYPLRNIQ